MPDPTNNDLILSLPYDVTTADTDMLGRLRLGGLVNYLILTAIRSADHLGFGFEGLRNQNLLWVLSRMTVEMYHHLKWYDQVKVETWPKDVDGLLYLRDFVVKNQHDEIVAKCTSGWLAIDIQTRRPKKVDEKFYPIFDRMRDCHALNRLPEKLTTVSDGIPSIHNVTYFDLDINGHVTSTRYVDWMMDSLPLEFHRTHYPVWFSINYLKETRFGETIRMIHTENESGTITFEGRNEATEVPKFRGSIAFE